MKRPALRCTARLGAVTLVLGATAMTWAAAPSEAAPTTVSPVTLEGEGTADVTAELVDWQNDVAAGTGNNVTLDYGDLNGDQHAKNDFLDGEDHFVISGVPFTSAELSTYSGTGPIISAPIMPSGLAFLVNPPTDGFQVDKTDAQGNQTTIPYGPDNGNVVPVVPGQTLPGCPTTGCPPVNVPSANLAAMILADGRQVDGEPLNYWGRPEVLATWEESVLDYDPSSNDQFFPQANVGEPNAILRQEPDDESYWMQEYLSNEAPGEWDFPGPITQSLPAIVAGSQTTELGLTAVLQNFERNVDLKTGTQPAGGVIAVAPPSGADLVDQDEDTQAAETHSGQRTVEYAVPEFMQLQNANGDWTAPTPGAIEAGVDAGAVAGKSACSTTNQNALYASTTDVPGAYPISWVDCLYAPSSGLSISQTDALAGVIRYLVTTGQTYTEPNGDGALPNNYVNEALAAANTVVTDNCPTAGGEVVLTSKGTAWSTASAGVSALGAVDQCDSIPAASTYAPKATPAPAAAGTTASSGSGQSGASFGSGIGSFSDLAGSGLSDTPPQSTAEAGGPATAGPSVASSAATAPKVSSTGRSIVSADIAANLPIPLSTSFSQGIDKLASLVVGALIFLFGRRMFGAMRSKAK